MRYRQPLDPKTTATCSLLNHENECQRSVNTFRSCIFGVTAQAGTMVPGNNRRRIRRVWKVLCYGKAETLEDVEEAARWWRYNLER